MVVILILFAVSLAIAFGFLIAFFWGVKDGQFDDEVGPAYKVLFENENNNKINNK